MVTMPSTKTRKNRLSTELSPYLQQHATNPVDWYPWGDEAFQKAKEQDKPIFLSIGYATCHWCHVMAHESFEDEDVGKILNDAFICVKVDREERPDIDTIYMKVCYLLTGSGGWPLTIIMTPEKKPFFAATYLPKTARFGRTGIIDITQQIKNLWQTQRDSLTTTADAILTALSNQQSSEESTQHLDQRTLDQAYEQLVAVFDEHYGGFSAAPKFPTPHHLLFLLRYWKRTHNRYALTMVERTLEQMRLGGIFDQIGYGFHRYATDREWNVPHFEKMLYDQALLLIAYTEAYQATQNPMYRQVALEIVTFVARDMTAPQGGFYSAQDADSEGEEGKYYTWTTKEFENLLSTEDFHLAATLFRIPENQAHQTAAERQNPFRHILSHQRSYKESAELLGLREEQLTAKLHRITSTLYHARKKRIPPLKDDKILSDWNGLMIAALAKAGMVFEEQTCVKMAIHAATFLRKNMIKKTGEILHRFRNNTAGIPGFADDYAFSIWGFIELYQATFDIGYLQTALLLNQYFSTHFWDEARKGFFFTESTESAFPATKEWYDGAIPSANSVATLNLLRLGRLTANTTFEDMASSLLHSAADNVLSSPSGYTYFLTCVDFVLGPSQEIVIIGKLKEKDTQDFLAQIRQSFLPHAIVIVLPPCSAAPQYQRIFPFSLQYTQLNKKATVYVCSNYHCAQPITQGEALKKLLM